MGAAAIPDSGSSEIGHCSNVSDSGRVCNTPRSSVLFDDIIPTLTGLEGDMWASQLLTLNTTTSSASITFDFTNPTDRNGPTNYAGVSVTEIVMFNCPARGIGTNIVEVLANGELSDRIAISESCEYLVRGCSKAFIYPSSEPITLSLSQSYSHIYIAEITFYSSITRPCSHVDPLDTSVVSTSEQTSTSPTKQESSSNRQRHPPTLASKTSEIKETTIKQGISTYKKPQYYSHNPSINSKLTSV